MSKFINYEPLHIDEIDYKKCKYLYNEVCCNDKCPDVADYPYPANKCEGSCPYFEREE